MFHAQSLRVVNPFSQSEGKYLTFNDRIRQNKLEGKPCLIIIDGKSQTGKSTLARYICKQFDENYKTFFTVNDLLNNLIEIKNNLKFENDKWILPKEMLNHWNFFDEPSLEFGTQEGFWNERNKIMIAYTSGFGFLHNHLVMALPNIKGLSDIILTNITFRITVTSRILKDNTVLRKAFIKTPIYDEFKNRYFWVTVEEYKIPIIQEDKLYDSNKTNNFFNNQLPKWNERLNPKIEIKTPTKYMKESDFDEYGINYQ
jgi:hypothetical protein